MEEEQNTMPPETKTCCHCGTDKPASDFPRNHRMRDGLSSWCRACHNGAVRRHREAKKAPPERATCRDCGGEQPSSEFFRTTAGAWPRLAPPVTANKSAPGGRGLEPSRHDQVARHGDGACHQRVSEALDEHDATGGQEIDRAPEQLETAILRRAYLERMRDEVGHVSGHPRHAFVPDVGPARKVTGPVGRLLDELRGQLAGRNGSPPTTSNRPR
jgi:hypothetical protein